MTARLALITLTLAAGVTAHAQPRALQDVLTRAGPVEWPILGGSDHGSHPLNRIVGGIQSRKNMSESAMVTVKYAPHATLGLLLPTEMYDTYEHYEGGGGPRQMGDGGDPRGSVQARVSVQGRTNYSKATFAAIDLAKLR